MLVLTRKTGESIRVADGIIFTILECVGGHVKVGITAPPEIPIHREEVYMRIREENLAAASSGQAKLSDLLDQMPEELRRIVKKPAEGKNPDQDASEN